MSRTTASINKTSSLADLFIRYGTSTASEGENRRLAEMSDENFMAIPQAQRDTTWYAHCVKRVPGYIFGKDVTDALEAFKTQSLYSGDERRKKTNQVVGNNPQLYTPPFPIAWFESDIKGGHIRKIGYLLEQLPDNQPGLKATLFFYSIKYGVMPQRGKHILTQFVTVSSGGKLSTVTYQDNKVRYLEGDEFDKKFGSSALDSLYLAMILKIGAPVVKLTAPQLSITNPSASYSPETTFDKPLGTVVVIGSPAALKFDVTRALTGPAEVKVEKTQQLVTTPTVVDEAKPLFMNEIFKRLEKISLYKKETKVSPYRPGELMSAEASIRTERILRQVENNLKYAAPYQFDPETVLFICGDSKIDFPNDIALPSPLTWIDNCTGEVDEKTAIGALLHDQNDGKIRVTLFIEQVQDYDVQARLANTEWGAIGDRLSTSPALSSLLNNFAALGEYEEPLFIVSNIVFDKKTGAVSFSGDDTLPAIFELSQGFPIVNNYNQALVRNKGTVDKEGLDKDDIMNIMHIDRLKVAQASLMLARAVAKKDSRIKIELAPKSNTTDNVVSIKTANVPQRIASVVTLNSEGAELIPLGELQERNPLPKFDFTHQIHGADEWYVDRENQLRPLVSLAKDKNIDLYTLHAFTLILTPRDLSSPSAMQEALQGWHERALVRVESGFTVGMSREEAIERLREDLVEYQGEIPNYVAQHQTLSSTQTIALDSLSSTRELIASTLQNERLMPLPFATMLTYFGTRFIVSDKMPSHAGKNIAVMGTDFIEDMPKGDLALHNYLAQIIVRVIGVQLSELETTSKQAEKLITAEAPVDEIERLAGSNYMKGKRNLNFADAVGLLHARQPQKAFSAPFYQYIHPKSMGGYEELLGLATVAAIKIRPDFNDALERSRVACVHRDDEDTLLAQREENLLSYKPIILQKPDSFGVPSEESVSALEQAYENMSPSVRHFYNARPVGFMLAGKDKYANALEIDAGQSGLLIGSDYLDPVTIRRWFTGIPLKPGQPITIENLDEHEVRIAASRGLIKGSLYAIRTLDSGRSPDIGTKFIDTELKNRLHASYVDSALKQMIVASIIGEICTAKNDSKSRKKFQGCLDFQQVATKELDGWSRDLVFECEPALPPGSSTFTINLSPGVLTAPQIKLFETVNALMNEIQIKPDEMDAAFRFEASKMENWLEIQNTKEVRAAKELLNGETQLVNELRRKNRRKAMTVDNDPIASPIAEKYVLSRPVEGYEEAKEGFKSHRFAEPYNQAVEDKEVYDSLFESRFLPYGFSVPSYATAEQRSAYEKILLEESVEGAEEISAPFNNVLQAYASGQFLLERINSDVKRSKYFTQPPLNKVFELALLCAVDEFAKHKYATTQQSDSFQLLRSELRSLVSDHDFDGRRDCGEVFLPDFLLDIKYKLKEIQQVISSMEDLRIASKDALKAAPKSALEESDSNKPGQKKGEDITAPVVVLNGSVIQRIFREAGKSHPNNSPEREDDITRMKWLEKQLRAIGELII